MGFGRHEYLTLDKYHRNESDAESLVLSYLRHLCPDEADERLKSMALTFEKKGKPSVTKVFRDFVREARQHGAVFDLWHKAYGTEETFFPPAVTIHFNENMNASTTAFGVTKAIKGPGGIGAVENVLCDDILEFRRQACAASIKSFGDVARYYRGYLLACTALVEAIYQSHCSRCPRVRQRAPRNRALTQTVSL
jgi:hypothetical protein